MKFFQMMAVTALSLIATACGDKNQPSEDQLKQAIAARAGGGAMQIVKFHKVSCKQATSPKAPVASQCVAQLQTEHNPLGSYWDQPLEMEVLATTSEDRSKWAVEEIVRADPVKK